MKIINQFIIKNKLQITKKYCKKNVIVIYSKFDN